MTVINVKNGDRYDVYIGRPSKWGNPFTIGTDGTRIEVLKRYRAWIKTQTHLLKQLYQLKGKVLGCWCKPLDCHGDILEELIDEYTRGEGKTVHRQKNERMVSKSVQVRPTRGPIWKGRDA